MKYDIFISYSRRDSEVVERFCSVLEVIGLTYWIDREGIGADAFKEVIVDAIENSRLFIFFASQHSNKSPWTSKEIGIAVEEHKVIIPLRIDPSHYRKDVKFDLINLNYYELFNTDDKPAVLTAVLKAIDEKLSYKVNWESPMLEKKLKEMGVAIDNTPFRRQRLRKNLLYSFAGTLILASVGWGVYIWSNPPKNTVVVKPEMDSVAITQMQEVERMNDSLVMVVDEINRDLNAAHKNHQRVENDIDKWVSMTRLFNGMTISNDSVKYFYAQYRKDNSLRLDSMVSVLNERAEQYRVDNHFLIEPIYRRLVDKLKKI